MLKSFKGWAVVYHGKIDEATVRRTRSESIACYDNMLGNNMFRQHARAGISSCVRVVVKIAEDDV